MMDISQTVKLSEPAPTIADKLEMARVERIDPWEDPRWMKFLIEHPEASIFHHPAWLSVLSTAYGYIPRCLAGVIDGKIVGILPLMEVRSWLTGARAVCLPFSDQCGPIFGVEGVLDLLLQRCSEEMKERGWKYVEIRSTIVHSSLGPSTAFKTHQISLTGGYAEVMRSVGRSHHQHIAKAEQAGVVVSQGNDLRALGEFIRLNAETRRKHGVPPQPDRFFHALHRFVLEPGLGFVGTARYGRRTIASSIFLCFNGIMVHKYSASDEAYLEHGPNHLIVRDAIRWACTKGFWRYSFGRTDCDNEGLRRFKRKWGAAEKDLVYMELPPPDDGSRSGRTRNMAYRLKPVLKRLPMSVLKQIGKKFYAHGE